MANSKLTAASEVQFLKGVGPVRAELLASRGIRTVEDLLYYTPFRYEDRTRLTRIRDLVPGQTTTVFAKVLTCGLMRTRSGMYIYDLAASDSSGMLRCKWFNAVYLEKNKVFHSGQQVFFYGKVDRDRYGTGTMEIIQPQFEILPEEEAEGGDSLEMGRVVPIYESIASLGPRVLRRLMWAALEGRRRPNPGPAAGHRGAEKPPARPRRGGSRKRTFPRASKTWINSALSALRRKCD